MDQQTIDAVAEAVAERLLRELPRGRLPMNPEYLTAEQVAQMTGFSTKSLEAYVETASGATASRPELDRARADAARRRYDVLMSWDASRLEFTAGRVKPLDRIKLALNKKDAN